MLINYLKCISLILLSVFHNRLNAQGQDPVADEVLKQINNENIVLIGEQNHSTKEQFEASFSIIRNLVTEHHYNLLLTESNFIDTFIALKKGQNFPINTISPIYRFSEEYRVLQNIDSLLDHVGFDCQVFLENDEINFLSEYFQIEESERNLFTDGVSLLGERKSGGIEFELYINKLIAENTSDLDRQALKNLLICSKSRALEEKYAPDNWLPSYGNIRDAMMAENAIFWHQYFNKNKFIALGASTHFAYGFDSLDHFELSRYKVMGHHLKNWQKENNAPQIINISFTSAEGWYRTATNYQTINFEAEEGTLEYEVLQSGNKYEIYNSNELNHIKAKAIDGTVVEGNYGFAWDLLVVFSHSTGIERLKTKGMVLEIDEEIRNIVLDSATFKPVPFANIIIEKYQEGTNANEKGEFIIRNRKKYADQNLIVSSIGYKSKIISFSTFQSEKPIYLKSSTMLLDDIEVKAKAESPLAILNEAIKSLNEINKLKHVNYFQINSKVIDTNDTLRTSTINEIAWLGTGQISINIVGLQPFNKSLFEKLGFYASYPWRGLLNDHYLQAAPFQNSRLEYFDLVINKNQSNNEVIVIDFNAKKLSKKILNVTGAVSYSGKIWLTNSYELQKSTFDMKFEDGNSFNTTLYYKLIDQELIPVIVHEQNVINGKSIENLSSWLKTVDYKNQPLINNYDLLSIKPSNSTFELYNQFIIEKKKKDD